MRSREAAMADEIRSAAELRTGAYAGRPQDGTPPGRRGRTRHKEVSLNSRYSAEGSGSTRRRPMGVAAAL